MARARDHFMRPLADRHRHDGAERRLAATDTGLGATNADKLWMVNAYSLVMAGLLPGFGALADKIGHRTILLVGIGLGSHLS